MDKNITVRCPTCQKPVAWKQSSAFRPFCSERCRLIDLGEWANEEKVIPGPELPGAVNPDADKEDEY
ncbi:DNA gyrase inhibitor YacG [Aliidiomarina minuta]|uniref:DNA gyrase inhibitor YacG n=1 Tax=Aliidiomarina minuta TaxID=880057 RepID=A0A432W981_9GAMM|nr:DNA gyrase inhibitor YacG [Aliidiomarina minuta]RUO26611.1 DNA gyrase inhibitor YacG [Aliidiomarina minuta]